MIITSLPLSVAPAEDCSDIGPVALTDVSPVVLTDNLAALMVTPVVSMVMLLDPTVSVIDCPAVIELLPALTVIEWLP